MSEDKRFYGVYEGICMDNADPDNEHKIKLMVPQVTGMAVTDWARPIGGAISQAVTPHGTFSSVNTQNVTAANTATLAYYDSTEDASGIYVDGDQTKIYVPETGDYFLEFSALFSKTTSSSSDVDMWILKNGVAVPRSNTRSTLSGNPADTVMSVSFILDMQAGDYMQLAFSSADSHMSLKAYTGLTGPTRPDIPSIILTLHLIGHFIPQPGAKVWVTYIGGDPNFPVWIGT